MTNCCGMFLMQNLRRLAQALVTTFKFSYKVCTNLTIKLLLNVSFWSEKTSILLFSLSLFLIKDTKHPISPLGMMRLCCAQLINTIILTRMQKLS